MINRPQLRFKHSCTCVTKEVSTPDRKFSERIQKGSWGNIVHTDKPFSSLILKSQTPTSTCQWSPDYIELTLHLVQRKPRGNKKLICICIPYRAWMDVSQPASPSPGMIHQDNEDIPRGKDLVPVLERRGAQLGRSQPFQLYTKSELLSLLGNIDKKSKPDSNPVSQAGLVPLLSKVAQRLILLVILWESNKQCSEKRPDYWTWKLYTNILAGYLKRVDSESSLKTDIQR